MVLFMKLIKMYINIAFEYVVGLTGASIDERMHSNGEQI